MCPNKATVLLELAQEMAFELLVTGQCSQTPTPPKGGDANSETGPNGSILTAKSAERGFSEHQIAMPAIGLPLKMAI